MSNALLITDAGLAALVNAEKNGTLPVVISHLSYGSGQYKPTASQTALKTPIKNVTAVSGGAVGEHVLHVTAEDASSDAYTVYEVGVFLADGTLFAVASQNSPFLQKAAASISLLSVDITLADFSAASVTVGDTNFFNPPATTDMEGVVELATNDETITGTDAVRAVTPAGLSARTATTSRTGLVELATAAEAIKGTDGSRALTPAGLVAALVREHGETGFQKLPGGLIIQWGKALIAPNGSTAIVFPASFPNAALMADAVAVGDVQPSYSVAALSKGLVNFKHNANGGVVSYWLALGR